MHCTWSCANAALRLSNWDGSGMGVIQCYEKLGSVTEEVQGRGVRRCVMGGRIDVTCDLVVLLQKCNILTEPMTCSLYRPLPQAVNLP